MKKLVTTFVLNALWVVASVSAAEISNDPMSGLTIFEFAAVNDRGFSTVVEGVDTWSDWIEIHNAGTERVDLTGWRLTDSRENLDKWEFPSTFIEPDQYLLVLASGKDRQPQSCSPG